MAAVASCPLLVPKLLDVNHLSRDVFSRSRNHNTGCKFGQLNLKSPSWNIPGTRSSGYLCGSSISLWKSHEKLSGSHVNATIRSRDNGRRNRGDCAVPRASLDALIFDCDGVILESEDLHRQAYNLIFKHFDVKCGGDPVVWDTEYYDVLQNTIGGGKPKMRWHFGKNGWPSSELFSNPPENEDEQATLINNLQDWKTTKYKELISSGAEPRPGVVELMDEAASQGLKLAVCSAATKSSVVFCLTNLLGKERFEKLDCFLAGDDVKNKNPDPTIYRVAAEKLNANPERCLVVEDSVIGLQAALGAGMNCIITYTDSTSAQDFAGAKATFSSLAGVGLNDLLPLVEITAKV
jgi:HAD superfamily hydrolase (TIGR01509 family)